MLKNYFTLVFLFFQISLFAQIPTDGLKLYLPFDGNALDESGNDNNGTVNGATLTEDRFGNPNSAYSFDGINDIITIIDNNSLDLSNKFSISVWINSADNSNGENYNHVIGKWGSLGTASYLLHTIKDTGNPKLAINDGYDNYGLVSSQEVLENQWYHLVGIQRDDTFEIFINGILTDTYTMSVPVSPLIGNGDITIGNSSNSKQTYNGILDDIRIYNRALSSTEITSIYNEGVEEPLTYVPDDNFEQALIDLGYDDVLDDYVVTSNISVINSLNVSGKNISNFTGIEGFISLQYLDCSNNFLTIIDLSKNTSLINLLINTNGLTELDMTNNTELLYLNCNYNNISELDFKNNLKLQNIFSRSNKLTNIDLSQNTEIKTIWCYQNELTSLDVSGVTNLEELQCNENQIKHLDLSQNKSLNYVWCQVNNLEYLNVKNDNNSSITVFEAWSNPLLNCIQVDNENAANGGIGVYQNWLIDDGSTAYSEDCSAYLGVDDEILAEGLNLYPNPVSDKLTVDSKVPIETVEIFNILGQKVKEVESDFNSISTNHLSRGIYLIRIYSEKGTTVRKLIKQ